MKQIIIMVMLSISIFANITDELKKDLQNRSDKVVTILKNKNLSKEEQNSKIDATIKDMFDYELMAKLSIGKDGWNKLKTKEQEEYIELFTEHIKNSYYEKTHLLSDEKVDVTDAKETKSRVYVTTKIQGVKDTLELVYKFYRTKTDNWLVYDIEIAGVSIIQSYRTQFQEIIQDSNPLKLIEKLKELKKSYDDRKLLY
ncbi:MAG: ABC transporter substrate-binding protein [Campylobacterales bacterium]|nr:ABC transporter substrate-binding protein [Campylobacterales bacterium]